MLPKNSERPYLFFSLRPSFPFLGLIWVFMLRDLRVRYKQTALGIIWVILQPLATGTLFYGIFSQIPSIQCGDLPYFIFILAGLIPWQLFQFSFTHGASSLIQDGDLIKKVYFPRMIIPVSAILSGLIDFAISLLLLVVFAAFVFHTPFHFHFCSIFWSLYLLFTTSFGLGIFLSALNVKYRDVRYALPFLTQLLFYTTPIFYNFSKLSENVRYFLSFSPITLSTELFRQGLFYSATLDPALVVNPAPAALVGTLIFFFSLYYFKKTETFFADLI